MEKNPYKDLLDEIPDFIFFHDLEGRVVDVNAAVTRLLGYREDEILGRKIVEFFHTNYRDGFQVFLNRLLEQGEAAGTVVVLDKKGKTRVLDYRSKVIFQNGTPVGVRGIARDISVRKRMEEALKDRETLYRTLFENAEDAIFLMEGEYFIDCNPKALEVFGCKREDILGKAPYTFSPKFQPDGRLSQEKAREKIEAASGGVSQRFEWQHTRLDGTPFDTIVSLYRISVRRRAITVAVVHDISEYKKVIRALAESERQYREVAENANVAILRYTPDGVYTFVNRYAEKLFGFSREEVVGKKNVVGTVIPKEGEGSRELIEMFRDLCRHPERYYENENKNVVKGGKTVYIAWRNQAIRDEKGDIKEILSIGADVTKIRELEEELLQAKKLEAVGTLAGGIAHDFNNILGGMMGYLSLLKEHHNPKDPHYEILEKIMAAGEQASDLIKQLLAFSRRGKFEQKLVDLNRVIQSVLEILKRSIPKKVRVVMELKENLPSIMGDPSQMDQIVMNTCLNAIHAMPEGGILKITTAVVSSGDLPAGIIEGNPAERYVEMSIADTGMGMDPYTKEHIFEPFFTTKTLRGGTGLGLSTVYGIVKNHAGGVSVESEKGKGSIFRFYLPVKETLAKRQLMETKTPNPVRGKGKILVADDEEIFREMLKDVLEHLGYDVLLAKNGKEGVEVYKTHCDEIDLVILDMNMPVMDGKEMFRELRKYDSNVKVLLSTGFTLDGEVQELMDEGVMGFIQKPFRIEKISQAIDALMKFRS